jgi:hypothetical protein
VVIATALFIFLIFSAVMGWVRQYLVLHTSLSEILCERSHTTIMSSNRKDSYDKDRPSHPGQTA